MHLKEVVTHRIRMVKSHFSIVVSGRESIPADLFDSLVQTAVL